MIDEMLVKYEEMQNTNSYQSSEEQIGENEFYFAKKTKELEEKGLAPWFGGTNTKSFFCLKQKNLLSKRGKLI